MDLRIQCLDIDSTDPHRVATFWQAALGWRRTYEEPDEVVLEPPEGSPEHGTVPDLLFLRVPEERPVRTASTWTFGPKTRLPRLRGWRAWGPGASTSASPPTSAG